MILDEFVNVSVRSRNITYYKNKGYNFEINNTYMIPISDLNINSLLKINAECDICKIVRDLSFQKYNKSLGNSGYYSCKKCSHSKIVFETDKISKRISESRKEKYDEITKQIEIKGELKCEQCESILNINNFRKNKNGRYLKACKKCNYKKYKRYLDNLSQHVRSERKRKYYRNSIHLNIWRSILKSYFKRNGLKKNINTIGCLGYSSSDLKNHLQSKFDENMNWGNYGSYWHIDHIIPISLFKIDSPIFVVNSLINLRPLEKNENFHKSNILDEESLRIIGNFKTYLKENI